MVIPRCCNCHKWFTEKQITRSLRARGQMPSYCSIACKNAWERLTGYASNNVNPAALALQEPTTGKEAKEFMATLEQCKVEAKAKFLEQEGVAHLFLPDDCTPEQEVEFRKRICPNPQMTYATSSESKYIQLARNSGYNISRSRKSLSSD